jgi:autotransporter-associated beta strand protein
LAFNGGTLQTASDRTLANPATIAAAGAFVDTVSNTLILSGAISGGGALTKSGAGTLTLSGANTYGGVTTINAGQLVLANANAVQNSTVSVGSLSNALAFSGGMSFTLGGLQGSGDISIEGGGISVGNNNANTAYSGALTGAGSLTKIGTGTLTLTGTNAHTGGTTLSGGILNVSADNNLGASDGALTFDGGTLQFGGSFAVGSSRNVSITSIARVDTNGNTGTIDSAIGGVGGLTKVGTGTLVLPVANSYTGATAVSAGTLQLADANAIASSSGLTLANNTVLQLRSDTGATFTTPGNGTTTFGQIATGATATVDVNSNGSGTGNTLRLSGGIGLDTTGGSATLNITGGNGYVLRTPVTLRRTGGGGQLTLNPTTASVIVDGIYSIDVPGNSQGIILGGTNTGANEVTGTLTGEGLGGAWLTLDKNTAATWKWSITNTPPMNPVNISAGDFIITGTIVCQPGRNLTQSGGTLHYNSPTAVSANGAFAWIISGGNLDNSSGAPITSTGNPVMAWNGNVTFLGSQGANSNLNLGTGAVTMNATRTVTVTNAATTLTVGGVISGPGFGLTKAGDGTLALSGENDYGGATTINAGTLLVNSPGSLAASSAVTVKSGATLGGTGTIGGAVTVESGGVLAPGASAGTLKANTSVAMAADSTYMWQFDSTTEADKVEIAGSLQLETGWKLSLGGTGTPAPGSKYDLFTYSTFSGSFAGDIISLPSGWPTAKIGQEAGRIYLSFGKLGDTNADGVVNAADFINLKKNFGTSTGAGASAGDFNASGTVNWADLNILTNNMGINTGGAPLGGPGPAVTPEPATLGLLMVGAAALLRRRRS